MSQEQIIRNDFLAQACQYLFGKNARCESFQAGFRNFALGVPTLQPALAGTTLGMNTR